MVMLLLCLPFFQSTDDIISMGVVTLDFPQLIVLQLSSEQQLCWRWQLAVNWSCSVEELCLGLS